MPLVADIRSLSFLERQTFGSKPLVADDRLLLFLERWPLVLNHWLPMFVQCRFLNGRPLVLCNWFPMSHYHILSDRPLVLCFLKQAITSLLLISAHSCFWSACFWFFARDGQCLFTVISGTAGLYATCCWYRHRMHILVHCCFLEPRLLVLCKRLTMFVHCHFLNSRPLVKYHWLLMSSCCSFSSSGFWFYARGCQCRLTIVSWMAGLWF